MLGTGRGARFRAKAFLWWSGKGWVYWSLPTGGGLWLWFKKVWGGSTPTPADLPTRSAQGSAERPAVCLPHRSNPDPQSHRRSEYEGRPAIDCDPPGSHARVEGVLSAPSSK